ncbi:MAG: GNAT family N-acetyltransferase [Acidimicrobiales bacterium]
MSLVKRAANKAKSKAPRFTKAVVLARPLPVISDEKPPAGDDYFFKAVLDPTDPHLAQVETPERLEMAKTFFAMGGLVCLGIHKPTDRAVCKMWILLHSPLPSEKKYGVVPIRLAHDEGYLLDLWTHPDFRRQSVAFTLVYELAAVAAERYPHLRWVYCYAHADNEASLNLIKHVYGMWPVQTVTEVAIGDFYVDIVPGSDQPKFGPFSKKGRHSGDGFSVPGRPRTGPDARDYHHKEGWWEPIPDAEMCDDWWWSGAEWFDTDHPLDADGRPATPETLRRTLPGQHTTPERNEEQAS